MNAQTKVLSLRKLILENLSPLIGGRVALFGLPCHGNTGDTYIAMGELAFLQFVGAKVIYKNKDWYYPTNLMQKKFRVVNFMIKS